MKITFTILFEDPFWVGVFEREEQRSLAAARVVFGSEPSGAEVYQWLLEHYYQDVHYSSATLAIKTRFKGVSPKRAQREAKAAYTHSTNKAQETLRLELEKNKKQRKQKSKEEHEAEKEYKYSLRQKKAKEKRKGH